MNYDELYTRQYPLMKDGPLHSVESLIRAMGREDMDMERFRTSGAGAVVARMMENTVVHPDEHDPASVAFWAKRGMVKEFHGEDIPMDWAEFCARTGFEYDVSKAYPQNLVKKWTSFVPASAFKPENKGRKYPLAFVLHGAGNTVYTIDGWGFVDAAAEKEWIVIAPSLELDEVILEILDEVKQLYPIDESRVYVCGFSYGSMNTNILSLKHPEVFAAAAPCGGFLTDGMFRFGPRPPARGRPEGQPPVPEFIEPFFVYDGSQMPEKGIEMPAISVIGNKDGYQFPICDSPNREIMLRNLNLWARINCVEEVNLTAADNFEAKTQAEKLLGIPLADGCGDVKHVNGIDYAIGDLKDADGVTKVRIVCEDNVPHWPTPELSRLVFDFFSHFSRDPKTHESIYTK